MVSGLRRAVCVAAALASASAGAQPRHEHLRVRLLWSVAPELRQCPGDVALRREVTRLLGDDPFVADAPATLTVHLERGDNRRGAGALIGHITLRDAQGHERSGNPILEAPYACRELVLTLARRVALALEDLGTTEPTTTTPTPPTPPTPPPTPPTPTPARPATRPERPWGLDLGVGALGEVFGSDPAWTVGFFAMARARWRGLSLGAEALVSLPSSSVEPVTDAALRVRSWRALGVACGHPWRLALCAVIGAGGASYALSAHGREASQEPTAVRAWIGPRASLHVVRWGHLGVALRAEWLWTPRGTRVEFTDARARPAPLATWTHEWQGSLGVEASWSIP